MKLGEAELLQAVIGHAQAFEVTMGDLLGAKRKHLAALWSKGTMAELMAYDVAQGWPA